MTVFVGDIEFAWNGRRKANRTTSLKNGYATLGTPRVSNIGVAIAASPKGIVDDSAVIVEIDCSPTASSIQTWQLKTHSKILGDDYQKLRDYQDAWRRGK
jgi:hypothetical protein